MECGRGDEQQRSAAPGETAEAEGQAERGTRDEHPSQLRDAQPAQQRAELSARHHCLHWFDVPEAVFRHERRHGRQHSHEVHGQQRGGRPSKRGERPRRAPRCPHRPIGCVNHPHVSTAVMRLAARQARENARDGTARARGQARESARPRSGQSDTATPLARRNDTVATSNENDPR